MVVEQCMVNNVLYTILQKFMCNCIYLLQFIYFVEFLTAVGELLEGEDQYKPDRV